MMRNLTLGALISWAGLWGGDALAFSDLYAFPPDPEPSQLPDQSGFGSREMAPLPAAPQQGGLSGLENGIPSLSGLGNFLDGADPAPLPPITSAQPVTANTISTDFQSGSAGDAGVCIAAILAAEKRYAIPQNLLLAIGLQEAGTERDGVLTVWPWVVNSHGIGKIFDTREQAIAFVHAEHASGRPSTDVGCMQINMRWHPEAFPGVDAGFDPDRNADYAARYLLEKYADTGDWITAAGNYHSATPAYHDKYVTGIKANLEIALAGMNGFIALANSTPSEAVAKNPIAQVFGMRDDQRRMVSSLPPGAYRRQMERIQAQEDALAAVRPDTGWRADQSSASSPPGMAGAWWSADLSLADTGGASRSIYSGDDIEPVLPALSPDVGPDDFGANLEP